MLLPYRAKNPPERYPYATIALIALNVLVYACTTQYFLAVRDSALQAMAVSHATLNPLRLITAMFLHAEPLHLIGNMLFLWIFGSALEGRLGPWKYVALYLVVGIAGNLAQDLTLGVAHPDAWLLGASGAIMGLAGAYLYVFPYAAISVVFWFWTAPRLMDWQARWVVLWFLGFDIVDGLLFQGADGVGHLCHIGGAVAGFVLALALRLPRDDEYVSDVQKTRSEAGGDYDALSVDELETLLGSPTNAENVPLILAFCWKALRRVGGDGQTRCWRVLCDNARLLAEQADPKAVATLIQLLSPTTGPLPGTFLLRIGGRLESEGEHGTAARLYRRVYDQDPRGPDVEPALFRLGRLTERIDADRGRAAAVYAEQIRLFPNGHLALDARSALARLGDPTIVFSTGQPASGPQGLGWSQPPSAAGDGASEPAAEADRPARRSRPHYVGATEGMSLRPIGGGGEDGGGGVTGDS